MPIPATLPLRVFQPAPHASRGVDGTIDASFGHYVALIEGDRSLCL
jgi:hypothetical protein